MVVVDVLVPKLLSGCDPWKDVNIEAKLVRNNINMFYC